MNPEERKTYNAAYYAANMDKLKGEHAAWKAANPEERKAYNAAWRAANPEKVKGYQAAYCASGKSSAQKRMQMYGLSPEDFQQMLLSQKNACGICGETFLKTPHVDHCHKTGKVRGLLCSKCNRGLGNFMDSLEILDNAKEYLRTVKLGKTKGQKWTEPTKHLSKFTGQT